MKTDKSAKEILHSQIGGLSVGRPSAHTEIYIVNAMHQFADQEVAKYKSIIEKLLPLAEKTIYNRNEYLELLDEAKQLIK